MPKHTLTKTQFIQYLACPESLWLLLNEPSIADSPSLDFLYKVEQGNLIDRLAQELSLFQKEMKNGAKVQFQQSVATDNFLVRADITIQTARQIQLYEVKASTKISEEHIFDVAFQKMVFEAAGFEVTDTFLIYINKDYRTSKKLHCDDYLIIENIQERVQAVMEIVRKQAQNALEFINGEAPKSGLKNLCSSKLDCICAAYHLPDLPDYHIGKVARLSKKKTAELLADNILDIQQIPDDFPLSKKQRLQVQLAQTQEIIIQREAIEKELSKLQYPLYFLDYESFSYVLPPKEGFTPYQQMVFQYSLHTIEAPDAAVKHTEYLLKSKSEPLENLLAALQTDIGLSGGTVIVWNKGFECARNKEMADIYPQFADFLHAVNDRVYDLMDIFKHGYYAHAGFRGKTSIKNILPTLCPELSYKTLSIGNGMTATIKWHHVTTEGEMTQQEQEDTYQALLKYCELDTWAMVRIWEEIQKLTK